MTRQTKYIRKFPKKPKKVQKKKRESNDPHSKFVRDKFDAFTAPSVRKLYEEAMRGPIHRDWSKYAKEWLEKNKLDGQADESHLAVNESLCLLMEGCDKDSKWKKKNELTINAKDVLYEKYAEAFGEYTISFEEKAIDASSMVSAGRKQAQKLEEELSKKVDSIKKEVNAYMVATKNKVNIKNEEIANIEFCVKRALFNMKCKYDSLKVFNKDAYFVLMNKSKIFRDVEIDEKTYLLFAYAQKTLDQKQEAISALKLRYDRLTKLSRDITEFLQRARNLILVSHGFTKQEKQYPLIEPYDYGPGETPFFHDF